MKAAIKLLIISTLCEFLILSVNAQSVNVTCMFQWYQSDYSCLIDEVTIPGNEHQIVNFNGQHYFGYNNDDVKTVYIYYSDIPFIMTQLFTTFQNLKDFKIFDGGLRIIQ